MTTVKVTQRVERFRRSRNGAWLSAGSAPETSADVTEESARARAFNTPLAGTTTVEWPDGHCESFYHDSSLTLRGPSDSRLLPEACRRTGGIWFLQSRAVYANGERVEVPS